MTLITCHMSRRQIHATVRWKSGLMEPPNASLLAETEKDGRAASP
jgi:hypothetical protein